MVVGAVWALQGCVGANEAAQHSMHAVLAIATGCVLPCLLVETDKPRGHNSMKALQDGVDPQASTQPVSFSAAPLPLHSCLLHVPLPLSGCHCRHVTSTSSVRKRCVQVVSARSMAWP